jgi:hypothetical protein
MSVASHSSETSELFAEALAGAERQKTLLKQLAKALGAKKARAPGPPGPGSAWTKWTSEAKLMFPEEYAEHLAELPPNAKGVQPKNDPMGFAKKCRASLHVDEWNEFEAKWKEEHPKAEKEPKAAKEAKPKAPKAKAVKAMGGAGGPPPDEEPFASSSSSAAASDGELSSASKKSGLPRASPPPPKAAPKATAPKPKPPTKADKTKEKEAAIAAAAAAAEADPPVPFKYRGKDYLKNDKNQVWAVGEDGAVGAWHGTYDGKKLEKSDGPA